MPVRGRLFENENHVERRTRFSHLKYCHIKSIKNLNSVNYILGLMNVPRIHPHPRVSLSNCGGFDSP